jgi:uncharacterized coiled-coil protein SlyX
MADRVTLKPVLDLKLTKDSGKLDEIDVMRAIYNAIPAGLYLSSLFSGKMVAWFEDKVKNDFSTDLLEDMETGWARVRERESEITDLRGIIKGQQGKIAELEAQIATLSGQIAANAKVAEDLNKKITRQHTDLGKCADKFVELRKIALKAWFSGKRIDPNEVRKLIATEDVEEIVAAFVDDWDEE